MKRLKSFVPSYSTFGNVSKIVVNVRQVLHSAVAARSYPFFVVSWQSSNMVYEVKESRHQPVKLTLAGASPAIYPTIRSYMKIGGINV
jgi:hypothetical protein